MILSPEKYNCESSNAQTSPRLFFHFDYAEAEAVNRIVISQGTEHSLQVNVDSVADVIEQLHLDYVVGMSLYWRFSGGMPVRILKRIGPMRKNKQCQLLTGVGMVLASLVIALLVEAGIDLTADPLNNVMPISWDQAYSRIIISPDEAELERGKILFDMKKIDGNTVMAQSIGIIAAKPEECFRVVRDYNQYTGTMPHTVESKIVRSFRLEGGGEAVDFWTKIRVLGFETRYLIRVEHLADPENLLYRSFWTLVYNPAADSGCKDSNNRPCENDLVTNIGSHQFEPYKGNPGRTMHTYTLMAKGKSWVQSVGLRVGGGSSMRDVTISIREAVLKRQ